MKLLGHTMGDEAIRLYCQIVKEQLGRVGEVYRRGGDEILVLSPGINSTDAVTLGEALRARVEQEFIAWGRKYNLPMCPTASIGVVTMEISESPEALIKRLDDAQRKAKDDGKNRVVFL